MRIVHAAPMWALVGVVALCASCGKPNEGTARVAAEAGGQPSARSDEQILGEVKKAFAADPDLKDEPIDISVKDGRVSLKGEVSSAEIRVKAEDMARSVPEVAGVDAEGLVIR